VGGSGIVVFQNVERRRKVTPRLSVPFVAGLSHGAPTKNPNDGNIRLKSGKLMPRRVNSLAA
jgi:hypothetical protein